MSVENFKPEIWSRELLFSLKKDLVGLNITNQNYQGEITNQGDTVHITSPAAITTGSYTGADISFQSVTSSQQDLLIDQADYFAFLIDDVDQAQANVNLMQSYMVEANYSLADDTDEYVFGLYTAADSSNQLTEQAYTASNIYDAVVDAKKALSLNNVPKTGRWFVMGPKEIALVEKSDEFISASDLGDMTKRTGFMGRIAGFEVYESNNVVETTDVRYNMFGHTNAITYANQIAKMEAGRSEFKFSDFVKGLHVYGAKVIRPTALGYLPQDVLT